jgi:hypothetical protein
MNQYKIEKNIPIPRTTKQATPKQSIYPFNLMEVTDSFAAPLDKKQSLRNMAGDYKRLNAGWDYITREYKNEIRIWRIQ